jgi:hypothetical protein
MKFRLIIWSIIFVLLFSLVSGNDCDFYDLCGQSCDEIEGLVCSGGEMCDGVDVLMDDGSYCCYYFIDGCVDSSLFTDYNDDLGYYSELAEEEQEEQFELALEGLAETAEEIRQEEENKTPIWIYLLITAVVLVIIFILILLFVKPKNPQSTMQYSQRQPQQPTQYQQGGNYVR